jgi:signal transduction histidine kinase
MVEGLVTTILKDGGYCIVDLFNDGLRQTKETGEYRHEINNPLMGIINYAQLIKDRLQGKDETLEEFADEIVIGAERIAGIVRSLSAFATREITQRTAVPVSDLVESSS